MAILAAMAVPHPPIILPEIGKGEEGKIARTTAAYHEVMKRAAALEPDTVVITSPHATLYSDYFHISPGEKAKGTLVRSVARESRSRQNMMQPSRRLWQMPVQRRISRLDFSENGNRLLTMVQ